MAVREWEEVRDELIGKAETFLDSLGWDAKSVTVSITDNDTEVDGDECGQIVIAKAVADALGLGDVTVFQDMIRLWVKEFGMYASFPLPLPIREFVRGWNEGVLQ